MMRKRGLLIVAMLLMGLVLTVALAGCQGQPSDSAQASEPAAAPTKAPRPTRPPTPTATPPATPEPDPTPTISAPEPATSAGAASKPSYPGKLVVRGADGMLYVVNANGTGLRQLTDGIDPSWSPDGKRIAFVRWREPWGLYTINADGTGERRLTTDKHLRAPAWSPGGEAIAVLKGWWGSVPAEKIHFQWGPKTFSFTIHEAHEQWLHVLKAVHPDSGAYGEGDYPADRYVLSPSWAPDGQHLTYDGLQGIYVTAMGEDPRLLTPELEDIWDATPVWSPRGDRIAYVRKMHDHWEIWSMNTAGGDRRQLTPSGTEIGERAYNSVAPAWSPDGRYIAFLTDRADGTWQVYVMRADGSGQRRLLDLPVKYEFNGDRILDWAW